MELTQEKKGKLVARLTNRLDVVTKRLARAESSLSELSVESNIENAPTAETVNAARALVETRKAQVDEYTAILGIVSAAPVVEAVAV